jgi:phosphatidylserine/phosphatidylglycerophosphate/cardiolipin synthase-like enzyme
MSNRRRLVSWLRPAFVSLIATLGTACATYTPGEQAAAPPPTGAVADVRTQAVYDFRTWIAPQRLSVDPVRIGSEADIPTNDAVGKIIGPRPEDSLRSLVVKLWMIEHAVHTLDVAYYIFKRDLVGYAVLGALCDAVQRGVDVRVIIDSAGSMHPTHSELKALESCADNAGYMVTGEGLPTVNRARVQVVIFNALTKLAASINRRSHDKLLIADGNFPDKAILMTGGRNVSLAYYGIKADGSADPSAYLDLELMLRPGPGDAGKHTVGDVSSIYFNLLFMHEGNKRIAPMGDFAAYAGERAKARSALAQIKAFPQIREMLAQMPGYMESGLSEAQVRLAHELGNLSDQNVVSDVEENFLRNPNSISYVLYGGAERGFLQRDVQVVSPYLFVPSYKNKKGEIIFDGAVEAQRRLADNPDLRLLVITNSVLTSDNFLAQSVIDMDMAPRMLLSPALRDAWLSGLDSGEFNPDVIGSEDWRQQVQNPRIRIYQTGKLDSDLIVPGGHTYGKLHAKFILATGFGFIGTSNFDYRSRLFNNEMGFFFTSEGLQEDLAEQLEFLRESAYLWGSPEWLEMRRRLMEQNGSKASTTRKQRGIYKLLVALNLKWLI